MEKFVVRQSRIPSTSTETSINQASVKRARVNVEVLDSDIIADPRLRKLINSYQFEIRDSLRRRYSAKGPCQAKKH